MAHGDVENMSFQSSFEAVNPAMRDLWRGLNRNNIVHGSSTGATTTARTRRCA